MPLKDCFWIRLEMRSSVLEKRKRIPVNSKGVLSIQSTTAARPSLWSSANTTKKLRNSQISRRSGKARTRLESDRRDFGKRQSVGS